MTSERLQQDLGYRFGDTALLEQALTHRSASGPNNERLEFLGDSVLNFVIADAVFERRPQAREGELSRLRANLVNKASLAELARRLELGGYIHLGGGELKTGGHRRDSILADATEAVLGAIYLDGGFDACRGVILGLYRDRLADLPEQRQLKDPKTRLQEYLQSRRLPLPAYEVVEVEGRAHDQTFRVHCRVEELAVTSEGRANSRRRAEQQAAESMLTRLREGDNDGGGAG